MGLDDFQRFERRLQRQLDRLDDPGIDDRDAAAIRAFAREKDGSLAVSSLAQYCSKLRIAAERSGVPLVEMDADGVGDLTFRFRHDPSLSRGEGTMTDKTVRDYQSTLRTFFTHREEPWADDITVISTDPDPVDPEAILTTEDVAALVDNCSNLRDIALIELLADTGARIGLLASLRVRDVDLDGETATYRPNPNAVGLKGADIKPYPIIDATAALRQYLRHTHPRADDPDAALIHKLGQFDPNDAGGLSPTQVKRRLRKAAERADIEKPTNPHAFRHAAITRMYREGYTKAQIQHRVHWTLDTAMWERYIHLTAEDMNDTIFADAGVSDGNGAGQSRQRHPCGNCRETLAPHHEYCPRCGAPASVEARQRVSNGTEAGIASLATANLSPAERRQTEAFLAMLRAGAVDGAHNASPPESSDG